MRDLDARVPRAEPVDGMERRRPTVAHDDVVCVAFLRATGEGDAGRVSSPSTGIAVVGHRCVLFSPSTPCTKLCRSRVVAACLSHALLCTVYPDVLHRRRLLIHRI